MKCVYYIYIYNKPKIVFSTDLFAGIRYVDVVETLDFSIPISNDTDIHGAILVKDRGQI